MTKSFINILMVGIYAGGVFLVFREQAQAETVQTYWSCHGDINGDGYTDMGDFTLMMADWLSYADTQYGVPRNHTDLNGDGYVDGVDFAIFAENFGWEKPGGAVMEAYVSKYVSEDGIEPEHPYVGVAIQVHNTSPVDTDYDMKEVTFNSGVNDGVNYFVPFDNWGSVIDPNESRAWKVVGTPYISGGEMGIFYLYVAGNPEDDPNSFGFKRDYVGAKTQEDTNLDFPPLKIDLPVRKD